MGEPEDATSLQKALGLSRAQLADGIAKGEQAIINEFDGPEARDEDRANLHYVLRCKVMAAHFPAHVHEQIQAGHYHGGKLNPGDFDRGHDRMRLDDFVEIANEMLGDGGAQLERVHVLALRLYTTSSYPMRKKQKPHPFAITAWFLADGLRILKGVAAKQEGFMQETTLWRGMRDMAVLEEFKASGGTELAPMSTSASKEVAYGYAKSTTPLIFKFRARGMTRGVSIDFLSVYPGEKEFLYAPLTYICYESEEKDGNATVITVVPQQA